jgi:hypothetical protein
MKKEPVESVFMKRNKKVGIVGEGHIRIPLVQRQGNFNIDGYLQISRKNLFFWMRRGFQDAAFQSPTPGKGIGRIPAKSGYGGYRLQTVPCDAGHIDESKVNHHAAVVMKRPEGGCGQEGGGTYIR